MRESTIEAYFKRRVKEAGGLTRKFVSPGRRSVPDQIVIWPQTDLMTHVVDFVELKAPLKGPTAAQLREHKKLRAAGAHVYVVRTKLEVEQYVSGWTPP